MRKPARLAVLCMAFCIAATAVAAGDEQRVARLMTFNIRTAAAADGNNDWQFRREAVVDTVLAQSPDIVGFQEAEPAQVAFLANRLPSYAHVGRSREADARDGEAVPVFFRADRWRLDAAETGTFWLSDTPAEPGSRSWGNTYPRIATWARLVHRDSGQGVYVFNLHLDHESEPSRLGSAELVVRRAEARTHPDPVVIMGDFNAVPSSAVLHTLADGLELRDSYEGPAAAGTYHAFSGDTAGRRIDFILVPADWTIRAAGIVADTIDGRLPSDHFPVTTEVGF